MLCQFLFKNFKSYKEETTFDLQAADMPEFADSLIIKDKCSSLLTVSVVYGPNGGGKTNFIQALSYLIYTVVKPIHALGNTRKSHGTCCYSQLQSLHSFYKLFSQRLNLSTSQVLSCAHN